jgi:hypothetical protein
MSGFHLFLLAIAMGVAVLLTVSLRRMGWLGDGRRRRSISSTVAGGLAELNELLQPTQPSVEALARLHDEDGDEQPDDEGEPKEPWTNR